MGKRFFDIVVALLGLIIGFPLLFLIALLIRCIEGGPVLFRQQRPGLQERPFVMFKFRTMKAGRITQLGAWLRATSLDELPELWNVLKGEMSLVGPRPLLMEYLPLYNKVQRQRHQVKPGITGMAQIHGRNTLSWQEKFAYDLWYVEHQTIRLDLKILRITGLQVLRRKGINASKELTMEKFIGNERGDSCDPCPLHLGPVLHKKRQMQ